MGNAPRGSSASERRAMPQAPRPARPPTTNADAHRFQLSTRHVLLSLVYGVFQPQPSAYTPGGLLHGFMASRFARLCVRARLPGRGGAAAAPHHRSPSKRTDLECSGLGPTLRNCLSHNQLDWRFGLGQSSPRPPDSGLHRFDEKSYFLLLFPILCGRMSLYPVSPRSRRSFELRG